MAVKLKLNGAEHTVDAEPGTPLLWVIRDELKLTGTKFGCGVASCGACTVHLNGEPVRSCMTFIEDVEDAEVTTIEGLDTKASAAVQQAWQELDVVQCGYCQSGQVMSAVGLLTVLQQGGHGAADGQTAAIEGVQQLGGFALFETDG